MNYWFLYNLSDGSIYGAPYLGSVEEWANIPVGCGVIGPLEESIEVDEAFVHPDYYLVQNGVLTPKSNIVELRNAPLPPQPPTPEERLTAVENALLMII